MATITVGTNSWVTLDEANTYLDEKFGASAWASLTNNTKEQCLITAYRWINRLSNYSISSSTTKLKYAQIELAWYVYTYYDSHLKHEALIAQGVEEFDISKFSETSTGKITIPDTVKDLLDEYDIGSGGYLPLIEREVVENE